MKLKNLLSILIMFIVLLCCNIYVNAVEIVDSGTCGADGDNVTWTLNSEGLLKISGNGAMCGYTWQSTPTKIEGSWDKTLVKEIVIENGVTKIGRHSFQSCINLKSVTMANSVENSEQGAFQFCDSLKNVTLSENLKEISTSMFHACMNLERISIPNSVTIIKNQAFGSCENLTDIQMSNNIVSIGTEAFASCKKLPFIRIPVGVTQIGKGAFNNCFEMTDVSISGNILSIEEETFRDGKILENIYIPKSVTTIQKNAFGRCPNLTNIYYGGSENDWNNINIDMENNEILQTTSIYYNTKDISIYDVFISTNNLENKNACSFKMKTLTPVQGTFIIALYNEKRLVGLTTDKLSSTVTEYTSSENEITTTSTPTTYKIFFWDSWENIKSLCENAEGLVE